MMEDLFNDVLKAVHETQGIEYPDLYICPTCSKPTEWEHACPECDYQASVDEDRFQQDGGW